MDYLKTSILAPHMVTCYVFYGITMLIDKVNDRQANNAVTTRCCIHVVDSSVNVYMLCVAL